MGRAGIRQEPLVANVLILFLMHIVWYVAGIAGRVPPARAVSPC
jgi:hypothetical protein